MLGTQNRNRSQGKHESGVHVTRKSKNQTRNRLSATLGNSPGNASIVVGLENDKGLRYDKYKNVEHLLIEAGSFFPPIDVVRIANFLKADIQYVPELFPNPGRIEKLNNGKYLISINYFDHLTRQRFTIAHEIAHLVLHTKDVDKGITDSPNYKGLYGGKPLANKDSAATKYAADLLMPTDFIVDTFKKLLELDKRIKTFEQAAPMLANAFNVSHIMMRIRLGLE